MAFVQVHDVIACVLAWSMVVDTITTDKQYLGFDCQTGSRQCCSVTMQRTHAVTSRTGGLSLAALRMLAETEGRSTEARCSWGGEGGGGACRARARGAGQGARLSVAGQGPLGLAIQ